MKPPIAMNTAAPTRNNGANITIRPIRPTMFLPSRVPEFIVQALQPLAQAQDRIALPREQRVHAHSGLGGQLLEASSLQLVRDECIALLLRQLVERRLQLVEQHAAGVERLRTRVGRRQPVLHRLSLLPFLSACDIAEPLRPLAPEQ